MADPQTVAATAARPSGVVVGMSAAEADEAARRKAARLVRRREDAQLARRAQGGDEDAFRRLVERYERQVYWIAYDVLLDREEARDVTQETFVRVHRALSMFDPRRDFLNWVYRIARNLAIDAFRRRKNRALPVEDMSTMLHARPAKDAVAQGDLRERVSRVLKELPVEYRLALTLREFHGLTPREIAAISDCTYPTARWRLHRARAMFRRRWEECYGPPEPEDESR